MAKAPATEAQVGEMTDAEIAAMRKSMETKAKAAAESPHEVDQITGLTMVKATGLVPCKFNVSVPEVGANRGEILGLLPVTAAQLLKGGHVSLPIQPRAAPVVSAA